MSMENASSLLKLLAITPSAACVDYVDNKQQFHLHSILTEQRHDKTRHLSQLIAADTSSGLQALLSVDEDITHKLTAIVQNDSELNKLQQASISIQQALLNGHKIYCYGTGSTGRLAATLESGLWRPFWEKLEKLSFWQQIAAALPNIKERIIGEITGADRTLISSLEGFEDLPLIGQLQLAEHQITADDVVFAITEGGETPAVIGTILAAAEKHKQTNSQQLFFVYNNPDEVLLPFDRSRTVIEHPRITKISLATGPQAISGSTRMQATSIGLYVMGAVLADAIFHLLQTCISKAQLQSLGFTENYSLAEQLLNFAGVQKSVAAGADQLARWVDQEAHSYQQGGRSHYFAGRGLLGVFVDVTERSPTFRLPALDKHDAKQKQSWLEIWCPAQDRQAAWHFLLHRPFHGLDAKFYQQTFQQQIADPMLRDMALASLTNAGNEQQEYYDLSASEQRLQHFVPESKDIGVMILFDDEPITPVFQQWLDQFLRANTPLIILALSAKVNLHVANATVIHIDLPKLDPFELQPMIALKMVLNAVSSGIMAKIGRTVGNTMTNVQPGNLKLIGRATSLIQSHVNSVLTSAKWIAQYGQTNAISFAEANAVLFAAKEQLAKTQKATESAEVAIAIIRILEALRHQQNITWDEARKILKKPGLENYLNAFLAQ